MDAEGPIITLQFGVFNPKHRSSETHLERNSLKDIPINGLIHHNDTPDINNFLSGFEVSPCMAATARYMFLTRVEQNIGPKLQKHLQCIRDVNAKL